MGRILTYNFIRFVLIVLLQIAVFKNIGYYNIGAAFPYIYIILLLPIGIPNFLLYTFAFLIGLTIDAFYDSIGVHAAACVALAWFRIFFHKITLEVDEQDSLNTPHWGNMGFKWFSTYILLSVLTHHTILFFVEVFSIRNIQYTLFSTFISSVFTILVLFLIGIVTYRSKNRLVNNS